MINKRFDQIDKKDIEDLILNEVPEGRNLDYKQDLLLGKDEDKKEFLADVSSFANAAGGDLIYGISEKREDGKATGIPESPDGLSINGQPINAEEEIKKMEYLIRDGIEPRINSYQIKPIEGFQKGPIILLRIAKSWMPPHMVTLKGSQRFFARKARIRYPLDMIEIRNDVLRFLD
jgi:Divergent AAA domain.